MFMHPPVGRRVFVGGVNLGKQFGFQHPLWQNFAGRVRGVIEKEGQGTGTRESIDIVPFPRRHSRQRVIQKACDQRRSGRGNNEAVDRGAGRSVGHGGEFALRL